MTTRVSITEIQALLKAHALNCRQSNQTMSLLRSIASSVVFSGCLIATAPAAPAAPVWSSFGESFAKEACSSYRKTQTKEQRVKSLESATVVAMTADPEILKLVMSDEISDQDSTDMSMAIMVGLSKQCPQKMMDMVNDMGE